MSEFKFTDQTHMAYTDRYMRSMRVRRSVSVVHRSTSTVINVKRLDNVVTSFVVVSLMLCLFHFLITLFENVGAMCI